MVAILQLYLTDFGTYDPMFDVAYATALETEIDDAEAIPDDPTCPHRKRWGKIKSPQPNQLLVLSPTTIL